MNKKVQEYIIKRDKRKRRRKIVFGTTLFIIVTGVVLLKAPFFSIQKLNIKGNKAVKVDAVLNKKGVVGENIFLIDTKKLEEDILKNPYIKTAQIKREFPNSLNINVTERQMIYEVKEGETSYILNKDLYIMSIVKDAKNLSLINLEGVKIENKQVGKRITENEVVINTALNLANQIFEKDYLKGFNILDVTDTNNLKLSNGDLDIIIGKDEDLERKCEDIKAIFENKNLNIEHGYIDVSFSGRPVIKDTSDSIEKNEKEGEMKE